MNFAFYWVHENTIFPYHVFTRLLFFISLEIYTMLRQQHRIVCNAMGANFLGLLPLIERL